MNLYIDTSALIKLYVHEPGRAELLAALGEAEGVATSAVTRVEVVSALGRAARARRLRPSRLPKVMERFEEHWTQIVRVTVRTAVLDKAEDLAERHGLRALDAIHLASALVLRDLGWSLVFAAFDDELNAAARAEGFTTM